MSVFPPVTGSPTRLQLDNVDTDQLIPARFMSTPRNEGYAQFLLHDLARENPAARLAQGAPILIAGRNFGCGSSREAAVYALVDFGIRVVIAPSFGDIFSGNAVNNGLLTVPLDPDRIAELDGPLTVDLDAQTITCGDSTIAFEIDPVRRLKLLNGWDDIDMTQQYADRIAAFASELRANRPWHFPTETAT